MRRWGPVALIVLALLVRPHPLTAQTGTGTEQAATDTAMLLSRMEATGRFDSLYDLMHPDAQALIPRAAVAGWYTHEFTPRGPGTITVTDVTFGAWTWGVTDHTYPDTAEVAFTQPFADGSVDTDVVRLVQDDSGTWRWFFGRDRAFVEAQIAAYVPVPPLSALTALLPTVDDVEGGLVVSEEGNRTEEELAGTFLDPTDAAQRLGALGWQQNAYRFFAAAGDALPPGSTASIEVSLHRFRSAFGAADALPYFADERAQALGLGEVPITPVGDQVQEIAGPVDAGNEVTLYVRTGDVLIRASAVAPTSDPTGDALAAVHAVLARASIPVSAQAVAPAQDIAVPTPPPSAAPTPATAGDECAALAAWWGETAPRVAQMDRILPVLDAPLAGVYPSWEVTADLARQFKMLAEAQRASDPPPAAVELNDDVVQMFGNVNLTFFSYGALWFLADPVLVKSVQGEAEGYRKAAIALYRLELPKRLQPLNAQCPGVF